MPELKTLGSTAIAALVSLSCPMVTLAHETPAAASHDDRYVHEASAEAECQETSASDCRALATEELKAREGYLFSIQSIELHRTNVEHCVEIRNKHVFGNITVIHTPYGDLPFTDYVNLRVECLSGPGGERLGQVPRISWEASVIANKVE